MFETIKGIIGDIAGGAIKDQRIALTQEQLAALDLKLRDSLEQLGVALADKAQLAKRVSELEQLVADRDAQLQNFQAIPPGDKCPYCNHKTGTLQEIKPNRVSGQFGFKTGLYKCSQCGKTYEKDME